MAGVSAVVRDIITIKQAEVDFLMDLSNRRKSEKLVQGIQLSERVRTAICDKPFRGVGVVTLRLGVARAL